MFQHLSVPFLALVCDLNLTSQVFDRQMSEACPYNKIHRRDP